MLQTAQYKGPYIYHDKQLVNQLGFNQDNTVYLPTLCITTHDYTFLEVNVPRLDAGIGITVSEVFLFLSFKAKLSTQNHKLHTLLGGE